ncbi:hypothetical protein BKA70DRAFT_1446632 [Coprinopsis sp. MPI-PUGE-AT-0042]|nr:hypothetical protein BKA70DRAFT_1446632 [Coprinopsis sp. MPI-PUGE-AT-0042]
MVLRITSIAKPQRLLAERIGAVLGVAFGKLHKSGLTPARHAYGAILQFEGCYKKVKGMVNSSPPSLFNNPLEAKTNPLPINKPILKKLMPTNVHPCHSRIRATEQRSQTRYLFAGSSRGWPDGRSLQFTGHERKRLKGAKAASAFLMNVYLLSLTWVD